MAAEPQGGPTGASGSEAANLSAVEGFKLESRFLRGPIADELADDQDHFGSASVQLLKHHGTYQQDDRDERGGASGKSYMFMVRTRIPGGRLSSSQMLAELDLCEEIGNTTLRITSRQGLQLHGVLKANLQAAIRRINEVQLTTLAACGDVCRNVMCCPAPYGDLVHREIQALANEIAEHFAPRTTAYHELWLTDLATGERNLAGGSEDSEPIYGPTYLPRKFKIGIGLPHDNCVDLYTHDLGLLAVVREGQIAGYNVLVGGGQGVTPANKKTFPALAHKLCFVTPDQVLAVSTAIVKVQRDHGNREDRKQARMKYLIHRWGLDRFREEVARYHGQPLLPPEPDDVQDHDDHLGWHQTEEGRWFYGLNIENGRIMDHDRWQLKSAIREICERLSPTLHLTAHQSILFAGLDASQRDELEAVLKKHAVPLSDEISQARRWSMACVAWPTCGLSITESERALPGIIDQLESELDRLGLADERFTLRMTGCPNGCARPYNSDIGLVGKGKEKYTVYIGGRVVGDRLSFIHQDLVPAADVVPMLSRLFAYFRDAREPGEPFGDFCFRKGNEDLLAASRRMAGSQS